MTDDGIKHGHHNGYTQHRRKGVPVCDDCRDAWTAYVGDRRRLRKELERGLLMVPLEVLGRLLVAAPAELEEWVEEQIGFARVEVAITAATADDEVAVTA